MCQWNMLSCGSMSSQGASTPEEHRRRKRTLRFSGLTLEHLLLAHRPLASVSCLSSPRFHLGWLRELQEAQLFVHWAAGRHRSSVDDWGCCGSLTCSGTHGQ